MCRNIAGKLVQPLNVTAEHSLRLLKRDTDFVEQLF